MKGFFLFSLTIMLGLIAIQASDKLDPVKLDPVDLAIQKGLEFLAQQQKEDGSIHSGRYSTTMTALSVLAFLASGYLPDEPQKYGTVLRQAIEFVLRPDRRDENGYFGEKDGSRMYGHGLITIMLAETLGMVQDEVTNQKIYYTLKKAVDLILWSQQRKTSNNHMHYGGWRYLPSAEDSDLSVTISQFLALRAARNAGIPIPKDAIDRALLYIKRCYHSEREADGTPKNKMSACAYHPGHPPSYATGSAGLLALQLSELSNSPETQGSIQWLRTIKIQEQHNFFFYGTYYYSQAMYQSGGIYAQEAWNNLQQHLIPQQQPNGSWLARGGEEQQAGAVYSTAMAILALCVRYHYLPIYQR